MNLVLMKVTKFEDLNCWKDSRKLVSMIYRITNEVPFSKDFGLRDQIQRASVSVMTNIAEGFHRYFDKESIRFYDFAQSSAAEVSSLLYVAQDQSYITEDEAILIREQANKTRAQILAMIKYYRKKG